MTTLRVRVIVTDPETDEVIDTETFTAETSANESHAVIVARNRFASDVMGLIGMKYEMEENDEPEC